MGLLDKYRAKREAKRKADGQRYINERTDIYTTDPASTALLYTTVASSDTLDSKDDDAVDSYESESDRYNAPDTSSDYGTTYTAPTYDFSTPSYDSGSSSSSSSYSSSDSGSSYSSSDSGSSFSSSD